MHSSTQELLNRLVEYVKSESSQNISSDVLVRTNEDFSTLDDIKQRINASWKTNDEVIIRSHRKWVGNLIVLGKRVIRKSIYWYMKPLKDQQTAFNMYTVQAINEIRNKIVNVRGIQELEAIHLKKDAESLYHKVRELTLENIDFNGKFENMRQQIIVDIKNDIDVIRDKMNEQNQLIEDLINMNKDINEEISKIKMDVRLEIENSNNLREIDSNEMRKGLSIFDYRLASIQHEFEIVSSRVWRLRQEKASIMKPTVVEEEITVNSTDHYIPNFDYLLFESKFRGSPELIKTRQSKYISYLEKLDNLIDVGCGRGEFVSLMLENGKKIQGIELNDEMFVFAKSKGLPVILGDGIEYLRSIHEGSLGGVFSSHVIEHLLFDKMEEFIEIAFSKLKHGGKLILETPNPTTLLIFAKSFYMDPTHIKPVHPETLQFLLKSKGFSNVTLLEMEPATEQYLPTLNADANIIGNLDEFNNGVHRINRILFGPQDYAVIAER